MFLPAGKLPIIRVLSDKASNNMHGSNTVPSATNTTIISMTIYTGTPSLLGSRFKMKRYCH